MRKCDRAQRIKIEDYRLYKLKKEKISSLDLDQGGNHTQNYFPIQYVKSHQNKKLIHENELYIMNDLFFSFKPMADQSSVWYIYRERERRTE